MTTESSTETKETGFLKRLTKKILVVPTMLTAFAGAVPTALDMYKANQFGLGLTNFRAVAQAEQQRELWKKNFFCSSQAKVNTIKSQDGVKINVLACPSGDVLTTVIKSDNVAISKWITVQEIQSASLANLFLTVARAQEAAPAATAQTGGQVQVAQADTNKVKCQNWSKPGQEVNRIISRDNKCFRETVNVLTGKTLTSKEVSCDTKCAP